MPHITNRRYGSKYSNTKSRWYASTCIREQDNFGKEVPSFNIGGDTQISTAIGGFFSIMVLGLTLCYGTIKFIDLYQGNDPNIRKNSIPDSYGSEDYLTFADDFNFRLAFGARLQGDKTLKRYDP